MVVVETPPSQHLAVRLVGEVVAMRDPVVLDWRVPETEWERFRTHVESRFGSLDGYLGREAELAMREYADEDGYHDLEEKIDRLVRAAGRTPGDLFKEKISSGTATDLTEQSTTRVTVRVDEEMKERFIATAEKSNVDSYGMAFARAIQQYREGGRAARLEEKVDRIVDDAEAVLSELQPGEGADDGLSTVDRRTLIICNRLDEQFTDEELRSEISDVAGSSEPTIERYRDLVIDRLGYEPHPNAPKTVWVPASTAAELAADGVPREIRRPVEILDREERVRRIHLALGRRAGQTGGRVRASATEIRTHVFESEISLSSVLDLLNQAALEDGYRLDRSGDGASISVNVAGGLSDQELVDDIRAYGEADTTGLLGETTETKVTDFTPDSPTTPAGLSKDDQQAMDAATDGGGPSREDGDRDD